jgi:protein-disulfide isomerase
MDRRFRPSRWPGTLVFAAALACSQPTEEPAGSGAEAPADPDFVAGKIAGEDVTLGEVDTWIMEQLFENATGKRNPNRLFELRKQALEQLADERALSAEAERQGVERDDLLRSQAEKSSAVPDAAITAYYEQHKQRYDDRPLEQLRGSIRRQLAAQMSQKGVEEYVSSLREAAGFTSLLEPPRFAIPGDGPSLGPADAPVTLIEFGDYQCPFCKNAEAAVEGVRSRYPTQVRLVYRHFPRESTHPHARAAALASACAHDQGKFWEYHRLLFAKAPQLNDAQLKSYAQQLSLDRAIFDTCLNEKKHASEIDASLAAAEDALVSATPAFFVNGLPVANSRGLEQLTRVIDEELVRLGFQVPESKTVAVHPASGAASEPSDPRATAETEPPHP